MLIHITRHIIAPPEMQIWLNFDFLYATSVSPLL